MNRSLPALALVGALALGGTLLAAAPAQAAAGETYYSVPFSDSLIRESSITAEEPGIGYASFAEWKADGFPRPVPAAVAYRVLPWDSTVFADVMGTHSGLTASLSGSEWRRAGSPTPTRGALPFSSVVVQYPTSDELLVRTGTLWGSDAAEWHTMTFAEWRTLGFPAVDYRAESGYSRLAWLETIVGQDPITGADGPISYDTWLDAGRPTPKVLQAFPFDKYCSTPGGAEIRYVGMAAPEGLSLTFRQWVAAGSPTPTAC
ncbi:hypothetical protein [Clavibacter michiganensis]|uniref:hypothetical protein n=1 Tax=Clavibacter michiganensis TaxID=28447 RepID=UPI000A3AB120|nr:hypothetical protein [Clavibacter michiganensis]MBW8026579.1 hypothetical protein [Clavibacter michiganensis subsp. michiganensis]MDO4024885.1 hypothetical protein [Clavibacter michiganensis]MDO4027861.1 hypothetical protein [Clavibacter michiganensis]MDO4034721.1 hypothetical protein [Clavibacter michiganensis]MDO4041346.1 hypothetical protein [Clavibacter michiganensis]